MKSDFLESKSRTRRERSGMSFPAQWMQEQPSLHRSVPAVSVPHGSNAQRFLPNLAGSLGSFLRFLPQTASSVNPMPIQMIPQSVQAHGPSVQPKTIVLYPSSLKDAIIDWKEQFLNGEIEPDNPNYPLKTRWKTWTKFLSSKWSTYDWTKGFELPKTKTIQTWASRRRQSFMSASGAGSRDSIHSQHRKCLGMRKKTAQREASESENSRSAHSSISPPRKKIRFSSSEPLSSPQLPPNRKQVLK